MLAPELGRILARYNILDISKECKKTFNVLLKGDSGGPLTSEVNGRHVLIGDVSNGNACKGPYSVYGSIAHYRKWIDSTMAANGGANFCSA